jgi:hypothetical protein
LTGAASSSAVEGEVLRPGQGMVRVAARPRPFRLAGTAMELPAGLTLAEMVEAAIPEPALRRWAGVRIGGHEVPRDHWRRVRPKPGAHVEIVAGAGGGGEGGKNPLRTVLTIAVIAASIWVGGGGLAFLGQAFAAGGTGAALAAAGVAMAGGMLVNATEPPAAP